jgi:hypothetical protein
MFFKVFGKISAAPSESAPDYVGGLPIKSMPQPGVIVSAELRRGSSWLPVGRGGFMKRILAVSVSAILCGLVLLASDEKRPTSGKINLGAVTKVDSAAKMMTVKDSDGKETAIYWNALTKFGGGEIKAGVKVYWRGAEKDGKLWATWIILAGERKRM